MGRSALSCCALSQLGANVGRDRESFGRNASAPFNAADRWDVDPAELREICEQLVSQCGLPAAEALLVELGADDSSPVFKETFQNQVRERLGFRGDVGLLFDILDPLGSGAVPLGVLKAQLVNKAQGARSKKKEPGSSKERISTGPSAKSGTSSFKMDRSSSLSPGRGSPKLARSSSLSPGRERSPKGLRRSSSQEGRSPGRSPKGGRLGNSNPLGTVCEQEQGPTESRTLRRGNSTQSNQDPTESRTMRRGNSTLSTAAEKSSPKQLGNKSSPKLRQGRSTVSASSQDVAHSPTRSPSPIASPGGGRKLARGSSKGSSRLPKAFTGGSELSGIGDDVKGLSSTPENAPNEGRASSFSPSISPRPSGTFPATLEPVPSDGASPGSRSRTGGFRKRSKERLSKLAGSNSQISLGQASHTDLGALGTKSWGVDSGIKTRQGSRELTSGRKNDPLLVWAPVAGGWNDGSVPLVDGVDMVRVRPLPYHPIPPDAGDDNRQRSFVYRDELFKIPMLPIHQLDPSASARKSKAQQGKGWALVKSKAELLQHTDVAPVHEAA